jgi:putative flippase GtrA
MISELINTSIFKFGCVGVSGMIIDFSTTWLLKEKLQVHQYVANAIGFVLAVINNYTLNKYWTFSTVTTTGNNQFLLFLAVALGGLLLNNLSLHILLKKYKYNFYFLKLIVIFIVFIWNFTLNSLITFKHS